MQVSRLNYKLPGDIEVKPDPKHNFVVIVLFL